MTTGLRKFTLTVHVISSVGWLGAAGAYLALAVTGLESQEPQLIRAMFLSMGLIGGSVIVPCAVVSTISGLIQSLGTEWGLFRQWWIATKFALTIIATSVLLMHMPTVRGVAAAAAEPSWVPRDMDGVRSQLVVHAAGGLAVLIFITGLSIYKPWGPTPYGRRRQNSRRAPAAWNPPHVPTTRGSVRPRVPDETAGHTGAGQDALMSTGIRWRRWAVIGVVHLIVVAAVLHLAAGDLFHH